MKNIGFQYGLRFGANMLMTVSAAAMASFLTPLPAAAQSEASEWAGIDQIIITAQRRAENLQSVPLAITAFSEDDLREQRINSLKDISERTPGLTIGEFKPGQPQIFIRGIGSSDDGAAADPSVVMFIDEVYVGRSGGQSIDLFDLERIEVLRGPQGTLFGRNVAGGAINLVTKKPTDKFDAAMEATYGNLNAQTLRGYASGPLANNLFGKIAFTSRKRDGYMKSAVNEFPQYYPLTQSDFLNDIRRLGTDTQSVRGALRWVPNDDLEINVSADYSTRDEQGTANHYLPGTGNGGDFYRTDSVVVKDYDNRIRIGLFDDPGFFKLDTWSAMARIDYNISPSIKFTSLSSYRDVEWGSSDILGTPTIAKIRLTSNAAPFTYIGDNPSHENSKTFTQEFRLTSNNDSRFEWVAGVYYLNEKVNRNETSNLGIVASDGMGGLIDILPQSLGGDHQKSKTDSYAVFGQGTYGITEKIHLTLGARYTREKKSIDRIGTAGGLVVTQDYLVSASKTWSEFTPKVTLDYQATDDVFLYITASKGFKGGGYQGLAPTAAVAEAPFNPESVWLYEGGFKTQWFKNRARLNAALFYMNYKDLQVVQSLVPENSATNTPVLFTQNAADAKIKGVEIEFVIVPFRNLEISGSYTYLDTEYSNFFVPDGFRLPDGSPSIRDREGNRLRRAPKNTFNVSGSYIVDLASEGSLQFRANWRHIGMNFGDPDNLAYGAIPSYSVLGGSIAYAMPGDRWKVTLWMDNALDNDYFINNFPNIGSGWGVPGAPRTFGLTVNFDLN